jgi:hypothetical protein
LLRPPSLKLLGRLGWCRSLHVQPGARTCARGSTVFMRTVSGGCGRLSRFTESVWKPVYGCGAHCWVVAPPRACNTVPGAQLSCCRCAVSWEVRESVVCAPPSQLSCLRLRSRLLHCLNLVPVPCPGPNCSAGQARCQLGGCGVSHCTDQQLPVMVVESHCYGSTLCLHRIRGLTVLTAGAVSVGRLWSQLSATESAQLSGQVTIWLSSRASHRASGPNWFLAAARWGGCGARYCATCHRLRLESHCGCSNLVPAPCLGPNCLAAGAASLGLLCATESVSSGCR